MNTEFVRKDSVIGKKHMATQLDASFLVTESTVKHTTNVSVSLKIPQPFDIFFFLPTV